MNRTLRAALVVTTSALVACQEKRPDEGLTHNPPMPLPVAADAGTPEVEPPPAPPFHTINPPPNRRPRLPTADVGFVDE